MNVVHLVISGEVAGGQLVALRLAAAARAAGHRASFVAPAAGPFVELARRDGFETDLVPVGGALDLRAIAGVRRVLRRRRAQVIHTHGHFGVNVVGRIAGRLAGTRVVAHMHIENAFHASPVRRAAQVALDNITARACDRILAVSRATRDSLERQGYPRRSLQVVYNGVEAEPAEPLRLVEPPAILHVGRLAPVKGQLELIRALASVPRASAVLVGVDLEAGGAYRGLLEREAERAGVAGRVVFAGYRDDVPSLLAGCDVFCLPSHAEGLPLVVLEAMTAGKPVVASAVGGVPELVLDGETGVLVAPGDGQGLAAALASLIDDPERRRRLGEAGARRAAESFSPAAMTRAVLRVYEDLAHTMSR